MVHFLGLLILLGDPPARMPHPLAPSLPQLTPAEEKRIEAIIDRFIEYDTGKLPGAAGKKALDDFQRLPPEAIFVLVDGFNRAANMEASCPAVIIGKKVMSILNSSLDLDLINFARENIGADVTAKRHKGLMQDMQFGLLLRRATVQKRLAANPKLAPPKYSPPPTAADKKTPDKMTLAELVKGAGQERGKLLQAILVETEKRNGPQVLDVLGAAITTYEEETSRLSQSLLEKHLQRHEPATLRPLLKHDRPPVRAAVLANAAKRGLPWGEDFIARLRDDDADVVQAARRALVQLAKDVDHGPERNASAENRAEAIRRWESWWRNR